MDFNEGFVDISGDGCILEKVLTPVNGEFPSKKVEFYTFTVNTGMTFIIHKIFYELYQES